jgi:hypothetical protein
MISLDKILILLMEAALTLPNSGLGKMYIMNIKLAQMATLVIFSICFSEEVLLI